MDLGCVAESWRRGELNQRVYCEAHGIPTFIDKCGAIAHNKVIVIDSEIVITGSFNFTKAAQQKNAENVLVLRDAKLAGLYAENWQQHLATSEQYGGRASR